jgi:hypothetical protein
MLEREVDRATRVALEAVRTAAMHLRRMVGVISTALARVAREFGDLVRDYQDFSTRLPPESLTTLMFPNGMKMAPDMKMAPEDVSGAISAGSGDRIRTCDLWVMS